MKPLTAEEWLAKWRSTEPTATGCLLWLGYTDRKGYGVTRISGKLRGAHRVAWELANGPIPAGLVIDHVCRVPRCVNPEHMRVVTNRVNVLAGEGLSAMNARKERCNKGHSEWGTQRKHPWRRYCKPCNRELHRAWLRAQRETQATGIEARS